MESKTPDAEQPLPPPLPPPQQQQPTLPPPLPPLGLPQPLLPPPEAAEPFQPSPEPLGQSPPPEDDELHLSWTCGCPWNDGTWLRWDAGCAAVSALILILDRLWQYDGAWIDWYQAYDYETYRTVEVAILVGWLAQLWVQRKAQLKSELRQRAFSGETEFRVFAWMVLLSTAVTDVFAWPDPTPFFTTSMGLNAYMVLKAFVGEGDPPEGPDDPARPSCQDRAWWGWNLLCALVSSTILVLELIFLMTYINVNFYTMRYYDIDLIVAALVTAGWLAQLFVRRGKQLWTELCRFRLSGDTDFWLLASIVLVFTTRVDLYYWAEAMPFLVASSGLSGYLAYKTWPFDRPEHDEDPEESTPYSNIIN